MCTILQSLQLDFKVYNYLFCEREIPCFWNLDTKSCFSQQITIRRTADGRNNSSTRYYFIFAWSLEGWWKQQRRAQCQQKPGQLFLIGWHTGGGDFCLPVVSPLPTSSGLHLGEQFPLALLLPTSALMCNLGLPLLLRKYFLCQMGEYFNFKSSFNSTSIPGKRNLQLRATYYKQTVKDKGRTSPPVH